VAHLNSNLAVGIQKLAVFTVIAPKNLEKSKKIQILSPPPHKSPPPMV
jgi:hypothetical protein